MKKILLVSLVMLLVVSVAFSQFGIKGGINLGNVRGADKAPDLKARLGLAGGISYRIGLIMGLSLQPEVMYIQKGSVSEWSGSVAGYTNTHKNTTKLDYLDIPVLVKFNLPIPVFSPYIEGGVSYGILISGKQKSETTTNIPGMTSSSDEGDIKDQVTKDDLSWIIGVGFDISVLELDARFIIGSKRLGKDNPDTPNIDENAPLVYNNGIVLTVGFRF
jgi:hypothetical protein